MFFLLSKKADSFTSFVKLYFGKYGYIINFLFAICLIILTSAMFAGSSVVAEELNIGKIIFVLITALLCYIVVIGNVKTLSKINMILMPILIAIILIVTIPNPLYSSAFDNNFVFSILNGSNYVFINIVTLGLFQLEIGKNYTFKQQFLASLISSLVIGVLLFISNNAIIVNNQVDSSMPILILAKNKGNLIWIITAITIWLGLFTTLISSIFILSNYINTYVKNYYLSVLISVLLGLIFSTMGFGFMVNYIYTIIGLIGILMVFRVLIKEKETIKSCVFKKNIKV